MTLRARIAPEHAAAAVAATLLARLTAELEAVLDASEWLGTARADCTVGGGDLSEACRAALRSVLAAEAVENAAKCAAQAMRKLLTEALEAGPGIVRTSSHTASTGKARRKVIITGTVPPEWLIAPPPKPDTERIAQALDKGPLPFATLSNGGEPVLSIRTRSKS